MKHLKLNLILFLNGDKLLIDINDYLHIYCYLYINITNINPTFEKKNNLISYFNIFN